MEHHIIRLVRKSCFDWDVMAQNMIGELSQTYAAEDHGLDLRKSGFLRSEVLKADECVCMKKGDKLLGFVFFITTKRPRAIYITLMASFEKGIGSKLLNFIETSMLYDHDYVALRATFKSIGFYIKNHYNVFDFISMEDYVNGYFDTKLTEDVRKNLGDVQKLQNIQDIIVDRDWMPEGSEEFPLLKKRHGSHILKSRRFSRSIASPQV